MLGDPRRGPLDAVAEARSGRLRGRIDGVHHVDDMELHPIEIIGPRGGEAGMLDRDVGLRDRGRQEACLIGRVLPAGQDVAHVRMRHVGVACRGHAIGAAADHQQRDRQNPCGSNHLPPPRV